MGDIVDPQHEAQLQKLFQRACQILGAPNFVLRPLRRRVRGRGKLRSYALGYTRLGQNSITVDFYTPRTMKPRKIDAILRVVCHELAHHQAPPRLVRGWFRTVRQIHHPAFWKRYKANVRLLMDDEALGKFFCS